MSKIEDLSIGAISRAESRAKLSITTLDDNKAPKAGLLSALAFEIARRDDPKLVYKDFEEKSLTEITDILGLGDDEDPLE